MNKEKNQAFPVVVILICGWTAVNLVSYPKDYFSVASIILGLTGVSLYYRNNMAYDKLLYTWIYLQIPNISYGGLPLVSSFPLSFGAGFTLGLKNDQFLEIYFNLLPVALYFFFKYINVAKSIGCYLSMNRLRKGSFPQIQFPIKGKVETIAGRNKFDAVYQVRLDDQIVIKDKAYVYILLEPRNGNLIEPKLKNQVMGLSLCEVPGLAYNKKKNPFVDWVTVECLTENIT